MQKLIKNGQICDDDFIRVTADHQGALPDANVLVDVATLNSRQTEVAAHGKLKGVLLSSAEHPELIADQLQSLDLVAIDFPQFADGRGYSYAYLLRTRYGFKGEVRAVGDVFKDTLYYLKRCGFDSYAVRSDKDPADAMEALNTFSQPYQASVDLQQPLFKRRQG